MAASGTSDHKKNVCSEKIRGQIVDISLSRVVAVVKYTPQKKSAPTDVRSSNLMYVPQELILRVRDRWWTFPVPQIVEQLAFSWSTSGR